MNRWILPITGFTESSARPTGIERVWRELRDLKAPDVCIITPRTWGEDMAALAAFIARNSEGRSRVMVVAYSWGAGVGFVQFARAAWMLGIVIEVAVLADPVFRSGALPSFLPINPRSVLPWWRPRILVPPSVERVRWVRQTVDLPAGHDLVAVDGGGTTIEPAVVVEASHGRIDDSETFRAMALEAGREFAISRDAIYHEGAKGTKVTEGGLG